MYQSSTRKNFLDILLDPTAIAILGSIALHATIGATLPFFTQPDKAGTNGPTTVKVVELTPNELQRIPQAPPTPSPQVLPPVTQPTTAPSSQATPPSTPEFSTSPQTIPFPSIVGTPQQKKVVPKPKPKPASKQQKATAQTSYSNLRPQPALQHTHAQTYQISHPQRNAKGSNAD
jgi:outer membrane biosynthesis protein TonB